MMWIPAWRAICTASRPSSPRPKTTTVSPNWQPVRRSAVHRDRAQRHEGGLVERHVVGDARRQVARHGHPLGVDRALIARAGHAVAGPQIDHIRGDREDGAGQAIADRRQWRRHDARLRPVPAHAAVAQLRARRWRAAGIGVVAGRLRGARCWR